MKKTPFGYKKKEIIEIDWDSIPTGTKFKATINGTGCSGLVYKEDGCIYFCQDTHEGKKPDSGITLGYKYTWAHYPNDFLEKNDIKDNIKFISNSDFKMPTTFKLGHYTGIFKPEGFQAGCILIDWKLLDSIFGEYQKIKPKTK